MDTQGHASKHMDMPFIRQVFGNPPAPAFQSKSVALSNFTLSAVQRLSALPKTASFWKRGSFRRENERNP
jgi:hypothetical protein